ncbi:branched-chain amino acid ABC transporter permease [Microbaculum marinisediminis]|uniref:Branched-chain amino acid ABC transporter permease n=1 Tax=Microbaculum marinisediminis TaxID=2931392 RepID=A0AAW5R274_9HYPH|nr:branched-chain amino acid ABC transporter permease [Microbaculum sp. A6E488]MCT8974073.1 branched-chain amino acid ABC transporter permease [Microbaculum sp. A6E488]
MNVGASRLLGYAALLAIGAAAPYLFPNYQSQMAELWLFIVFALTWDLVGGQMGYNSFGNVVFIGVGMYVCAITQVGLFYSVAEYNAAKGGGQTVFTFDVAQYLEGLALGLPLAAVSAGIVAAILGSAVLGMRGHYFAICTLGLGVAAGQIANGWEWIGAGSGMVVPHAPSGIGDTARFYYYFAFVLAVITFIVVAWLYTTRFGLAINAIRDDEDKAEAMGLPTTRIKVSAWVISALFLGVAGGILGNLKRFIDPIEVAFAGATFGVWMVLMAILGGKGTLWGPVIGAVVFQVLKEVFWTYLLGWQRVALGLMIVLIVVFFPQGILGFLRDRFPERFGHKVDPALARGAGGAAE